MSTYQSIEHLHPHRHLTRLALTCIPCRDLIQLQWQSQIDLVLLSYDFFMMIVLCFVSTRSSAFLSSLFMT